MELEERSASYPHASDMDAAGGGKRSCGCGCSRAVGHGGVATDFFIVEAAVAGGGEARDEKGVRARGGAQDSGEGAWLSWWRGGVRGGVRESVRRWVSGALLCALSAASLASPAGAFALSPSPSRVSGRGGLILDKRRAPLETLLLLRGAHQGGKALQALRGGEGEAGAVGPEGPAVEDDSLVANGGLVGARTEPLPSSLLNMNSAKKRMTRAHSQVSHQPYHATATHRTSKGFREEHPGE